MINPLNPPMPHDKVTCGFNINLDTNDRYSLLLKSRSHKGGDKYSTLNEHVSRLYLFIGYITKYTYAFRKQNVKHPPCDTYAELESVSLN